MNKKIDTKRFFILPFCLSFTLPSLHNNQQVFSTDPTEVIKFRLNGFNIKEAEKAIKKRNNLQDFSIIIESSLKQSTYS